MLFASILLVVIIVVLAIKFAKVRELLLRLIAGTLAVALLVFAACALQNAAMAEPETVVVEINDYIVEPITFKSEVLLKVSFGYEGEMLSFYWDGQLDTSNTISVTIWLPGRECIDAEYIE